VLTFARDLVLLGAFTFASVDDSFLQRSALVVVLGALLATALGYLNARRTARVVRVPVAIDGLAPALQGFRIVQISDIHVGPTIKQDYLDAIVDVVNRLEPDLVAITGDLVDGSVRDLAPHTAPLAGLQSRHGTYFVTGNHEYYSGADPWVRELRRLGVRVLMNEHEVIAHGGGAMVLAGVPDYNAAGFDRSHASDPQAALRGAPADALKVLLAHQPRSAPAAAQAGFDLQLSGHTHGGQFWPWNLFVPLQQPYTAGLHRLGQLWIYVSRGTGYWGPPKRVGAPSEITELLLRSA
jgi:predicted MPP superfamily phosphohydrolase